MRTLFFLLALCSGAFAQDVYRARTYATSDLMWNMTELTDFRKSFCVTEPKTMFVSFTIQVVHRYYGGYSGPVAYAFRATYRYHATSLANIWSGGASYIPYAGNGGNIADIGHHYGTATVSRVPFQLPVGCWGISLAAYSGTDALPGTNGVAELYGSDNYYNQSDYNIMVLEVDPQVPIQ